MNDTSSTRAPHRNSLARLAAVQALYQQTLLQTNAKDAVADFMAHGLQHVDPETGDVPSDAPTNMNYPLFQQVMFQAEQDQEEIEALITRNLSETWTFDRIDLVLCCVLRAGVAELLLKKDLAAAIVINEYVNIAWSFYQGKEPHFVNSMMDKIARNLGLRMRDITPVAPTKKEPVEQAEANHEEHSAPPWRRTGDPNEA